MVYWNLESTRGRQAQSNQVEGGRELKKSDAVPHVATPASLSNAKGSDRSRRRVRGNPGHSCTRGVGRHHRVQHHLDGQTRRARAGKNRRVGKGIDIAASTGPTFKAGRPTATRCSSDVGRRMR